MQITFNTPQEETDWQDFCERLCERLAETQDTPGVRAGNVR